MLLVSLNNEVVSVQSNSWNLCSAPLKIFTPRRLRTRPGERELLSN